MTPVSRNTEAIQKESNTNRGIYSELVEHSQQSSGAVNVGKSRVQATDPMSTHPADRIRKLSSGIANVPSVKGSNDSTTNRGR